MKVLLSYDPDLIAKTLKENHLTAEVVDFSNIHFTKLEESVKKFLAEASNQDAGAYIINNPYALNYIPREDLIWIDQLQDGTVTIDAFDVVFNSVDSFFSVGSIYTSVCTKRLITRDKEAYSHNKIRYVDTVSTEESLNYHNVFEE